MSRKEVDVIDTAALIIIPYFAGVAFNAMEFSIKVFGGFDFGAAVWSGSGVTLTWAGLLTMAGLGWIAATNFALDDGRSGAVQYGNDMAYRMMLVVAFGLLPAYILVPPFHDFIAGSDGLTFIAVLLQSALSVAISYER